MDTSAKKIALPSGTAYVKFSVITHLFADAIGAQSAADGSGPDYALAHARIDRQLSRAVEVGDLRVRDPLTLARHPYPVGAALRNALIVVDDLRQYAAGRDLPAIAPPTEASVRRTQPVFGGEVR